MGLGPVSRLFFRINGYPTGLETGGDVEDDGCVSLFLLEASPNAGFTILKVGLLLGHFLLAFDHLCLFGIGSEFAFG